MLARQRYTLFTKSFQEEREREKAGKKSAVALLKIATGNHAAKIAPAAARRCIYTYIYKRNRAER